MPRPPRSIRITAYERKRYNRLLRATAHVAPYFHVSRWNESQAMIDALRVVREYRHGNDLLAVCREAVERLAAHQARPYQPRGRRLRGDR